MGKFKIGGRVVALHSDTPFFRKGDLGTIDSESVEGWWVNFKGNGVVYGDGVWVVGADSLKHLHTKKIEQTCSVTTPHRIMYEALTPEEYAHYCRNTTPEKTKTLIRLNVTNPSGILLRSFSWTCSDIGDGTAPIALQKAYNYWSSLYKQLENLYGREDE